MHIKSITLEGFKSYGTKQVINGFDPQFNAITGLNGSGKSNILDSICFVLGITNLTQVRATNLNELVYKNGQAGINKATVTITFDNSDPRSGPLGYDAHKEICVTRTLISGGKTKYTINGVSANNNRVHDLFQSVQLNVNNPHFLIMQGRITKVLNMKPMEILSMVEEAAGTRMYEEKKESAIKNLEKKDSKLREINTMLEEHICPQLEKLKADKQEYANYTRTVREYDQLKKLYTAWDYSRTEELVAESGKEKEKLMQAFEDHKKEVKDMKEQLKDADKRISEIEKQMDTIKNKKLLNDSNKKIAQKLTKKQKKECSGKLQEVENELKAQQVAETKADTKTKNLKEGLNEQKKKHADLVKNLKDEKGSLTQKEKELANSLKKLETLKANSDKDSEAITAAENHFHAVNAGLADTAGEEASLAAQLIAASKDKKDAETEAKSLEMTMKHTKAELVKKEAENKKVDKSYTQEQALYQKLSNEAQKIKDEISKLNYEEGLFENLSVQERKLNSDTNNFQRELDSIYDKFPRLAFEYSDPVKNFDRSKVLGPLCLQMELKDPKEALAIDMAAGGKLYNILVDNDTTSRLLLDKGRLKVRSTILPLNKMQGTVINNKVVQDAENLVGKGNAAVAISRINFDKQVTSAMEFAFGNVFICPTMNHAKKVTFANHIRRKSVTLEGEIFDPAGTLSGGSMNNRSRLLTELAPLPKLKKEMHEKQSQLSLLQNKIQTMRKLKQRYDSLCEQYELKENEAELLKKKIEQSTYHKQIEEFKKLQQSLEDQKAQLTACKEKGKNAEKLIKELEVKTSKSTRENMVKDAEKAVADCKKKASVSLEKYNNFQAEVDGLKMEMEDIVQGLPACEEQIEASLKTIEDLEKRLNTEEEGLNKCREGVALLMEEQKKQKAILKTHNTDIHKIGKEKEAMQTKVADTELQIQQLEHDIKNCGDNTTEASKKLKHLLDHNKWIESQKRYFGVKNSEFDFAKLNPRESVALLRNLKENIEKLEKNVNTRAQNMLSTVEEQYDNLLSKKKVVLHDKEVIENVIKELDDQKRDALLIACKKVNEDFGSIFSSLLPGTNAVVQPPKDCSVLDGLEFKVAFGNVWKESLNELSGGQRSLVALSLILALLLFNPAPIYILDEVDAALDLSHTQNIGQMLKQHFKKSQFIIVSLKDGMFNNANVLFRTKFSDGMSSVSRTCQI